jgi:hypothetical protein
MRLKELAIALPIFFFICGTALADEPPDDTIHEQARREQGFEKMSWYDQGYVATLLETERLVVSRRLGSTGSVYLRKKTVFEGVNLLGLESVVYFEIIKVQHINDDGTVVYDYYMREVPPAEAAALQAKENGFTPEEFGAGLREGGLRWAATAGLIQGGGTGSDGMFFAGAALERVESNCNAGAIGNSSLQARQQEDPEQNTAKDVDLLGGSLWASPNPATMMLGQACFLHFAGSAFEEAAKEAEESKESAERNFQAQREIAFDKMNYLGIEPIRGHASHGIEAAIDEAMADALAAVGGEEDSSERNNRNRGRGGGSCQQDFKSMQVWIDAETFVRRKVRFDGVMTCGRETQNFCMERIFDDYRNVPNSDLYEPYQEIYSICGLMTPEELEELKEAEAELGDYEEQLAQLPPSQQAAMRRMIEPQVERLRNLASGNAAEFEIITTSIEIDPSFGDSGGATAVVDDEQTRVTRIVQIHLQTLGYTPGNTNGELDRRTVVAIVQFQDDNGMEVTGEATPQLAGILAARVDAL